MLLPLETQKRILGDGKVILKAEAVQLCSKLGLPIEGHKLELRARLEDWVMTSTSLGADLKRKREASEEQRKKSKIEMDNYSLAETKPDLSSTSESDSEPEGNCAPGSGIIKLMIRSPAVERHVQLLDEG